jgi:hypothetical protein
VHNINKILEITPLGGRGVKGKERSIMSIPDANKINNI